MSSENKSISGIEKEQHEQLEYAHKRIRQKKNLYVHFVLFLIGSIFLVLINKILKYGEEYNWFVWAITIWAFVFAVHVVNVFVTQKFMGIDWERKQREKLVAKQRQRIRELQKEIETDFPMTNYKKKE
ncbi:MAG: 2TM domain-containing protein [Flavobacteriaceae bacterium]|nr:MAG: 2TM domain-containing protein [Flavobacteriaceae bacterium]